MSDPAEQAILQQCSYFHQYCVEQMIVYWISTEPNPEELKAKLITGWRDRASRQLETLERKRANDQGLIFTGEVMKDFEAILDEAERRVRMRLLSQVHSGEESDGRTM